MRTSFVVALLCVVALTAGVIGLLKGRSTTSASTSVAELTKAEEVTSRHSEMTSLEEPMESMPAKMEVPTEVSVPAPTSPKPVVETPVLSAPVSTPLSRAIDTLVSSQANFEQKQAVLDRLYESRQLDAAIESLERGATDHPSSAAYRAALGRVQLCKAGELSQSGGRISEMGLLGMHADQNFDSALELDPDHWEAQFFKAAAMSYWPLELNKGDEVIQRFSRLIDQQDSMVSQQEFAQTYVMLGDQYLKMDQPDYALATWQIGAQRFPGNPILRQRLSGQ